MTTVIVASTRVRSERIDAENQPLVAALIERGADARVEPWDAPDDVAGWSAADLVVVRTTWDYTDRRDEFLAWARTVAGPPVRLAFLPKSDAKPTGASSYWGTPTRETTPPGRTTATACS